MNRCDAPCFYPLLSQILSYFSFRQLSMFNWPCICPDTRSAVDVRGGVSRGEISSLLASYFVYGLLARGKWKGLIFSGKQPSGKFGREKKVSGAQEWRQGLIFILPRPEAQCVSIFLPEEGKGQKAGSERAWNFRNSDPAHFPTLIKRKVKSKWR